MGPNHRRTLLWLLLGTLVGCGETASDRDASGSDARRTDTSPGDAAIGPDARPDGAQNHGDTAPADAGDVGVTAPQDVPEGLPEVPSRPDLGELTRDTPTLTDAPLADGATSNVVDAMTADGGLADVVLAAEAGDSRKNDTGKDGADARAGADAREASIDSYLAPSCQGILLDNAGTPNEYPVLYREAANAADLASARKAELLAFYGAAADDYNITTEAVSLATDLKQDLYGDCSLAVSGALTAATVDAAARAFLAQWSSLFLYEGMATTNRSYCSGSLCSVLLLQEYCGLPVFSKERAYDGSAFVSFDQPGQCVYSAGSSFVPMVPIPHNVLVSDALILQAVLGQTLTVDCPFGEMAHVVDAEDALTVAALPTVLVRKSATVAGTLEYRLSVAVLVDTGSGREWTVYVDAIDGTVLEQAPMWICG